MNERLEVCVLVDDDPELMYAEELGHIRTIENNAARYHVTSYQDPSQQLDSDSTLPKNCCCSAKNQKSTKQRTISFGFVFIVIKCFIEMF